MLSRRTTVYPCSLIKLSISFNNRSLSGIRSCRRIIEPGRNLFWIRFKTFSLEGCSVSSVLIFQPTGVYPNMRTAFAIVGFVTPNGGRNNLIFCEVTRSNANWQACKSFFIRDRLYKGKWLVWVKEWLPIRCPSLIICRINSSFSSTLWPMQKKQAGICCSLSTCNTLGVCTGSGPSSKVIATILSSVCFLQNTLR